MLQPVPALRELSFDKEGGTNISEELIFEHVNHNIRLGLPQVQPCTRNDKIAILVCGGPSLEETLPELIDAHFRGGKLIAVNGAYNWLLDRNLRPSAMIMIDGREFNARFVERPVPFCRYLLSTQCHPKTFEICRDRDITIWHTCSGGEAELAMLKEFYFDRVYPITIGTTVAIRAITLLRTLGFLRIEIFGLDSCWLNDRHHAYEQSENNTDQRIPVVLRPTRGDGECRDDIAHHFECAPWHVRQMTDFLTLTSERGDLLQLKVPYGPGLIATAVRTGAFLATEEPSLKEQHGK